VRSFYIVAQSYFKRVLVLQRPLVVQVAQPCIPFNCVIGLSAACLSVTPHASWLEEVDTHQACMSRRFFSLGQASFKVDTRLRLEAVSSILCSGLARGTFQLRPSKKS